MLFDYNRNFLTLNSTKLDYIPYNDFDLYCFTATMLIKKRLFIEFRYTFFKAIALIK